MENVKRLIKRAFSTPDNIEEMSFLEIVIDGIIGGFIIAIVINLIRLVVFIAMLFVLILISSIIIF